MLNMVVKRKPFDVQAVAQRLLEAAAAAVGTGTTICSLSLAPGAAGGSAGSHLIVSRYRAGRPPLLVALPLQGVLEAAPDSASQARPVQTHAAKIVPCMERQALQWIDILEG